MTPVYSASSLVTVFSESDIHRHLKFKLPNLTLIFHYMGCCEVLCNILYVVTKWKILTS